MYVLTLFQTLILFFYFNYSDQDVECTFGILKGRWRILKTGIRVHNTEASDNIWLTCCALHNMLLDVDGLSNAWKSGAKPHWELESGAFRDEEIPSAVNWNGGFSSAPV